MFERRSEPGETIITQVQYIEVRARGDDQHPGTVYIAIRARGDDHYTGISSDQSPGRLSLHGDIQRSEPSEIIMTRGYPAIKAQGNNNYTGISSDQSPGRRSLHGYIQKVEHSRDDHYRGLHTDQSPGETIITQGYPAIRAPGVELRIDDQYRGTYTHTDLSKDWTVIPIGILVPTQPSLHAVIYGWFCHRSNI